MRQNVASPLFIPGRHVPSLDGVRGLAVLIVFIFHYGGGAKSQILIVRVVGEAIHFGWVGVSLFFVLSGFLISGILWDSFASAGWWSRFYFRRSLRIFPLYYLALVMAFVAAAYTHANAKALEHIWVYALYAQNIPSFNLQLSQFPQKLHLGHFWSLAVEEQFYLIWPFILSKATKRKSAASICLFVWIFSLAFRIVCIRAHLELAWSNRFLFSRAGELAAGALLALCLRVSPIEQIAVFRISKYLFWTSLASLFAVIALSGGTDQDNPIMITAGIAVASIFFTTLLTYAIRPGLLNSFFQITPLKWLGKISYGIYVYHVLLRPVFERIAFAINPSASRNAHLVTLAVVAAVGTLALATLSFYTYERVFLQMKDRNKIDRKSLIAK